MLKRLLCGKKINLLIIGIIYNVSCIGQKVALSDTVSIRLPHGVEILKQDQVPAYVNSKFSHSKAALNIIPSKGEHTENRHLYSAGDVLIDLVHGSRRLKDKSIKSA